MHVHHSRVVPALPGLQDPMWGEDGGAHAHCQLQHEQEHNREGEEGESINAIRLSHGKNGTECTEGRREGGRGGVLRDKDARHQEPYYPL